MENFNQIQVFEPTRKKEVIILAKAPSEGYKISDMYVYLGYVIDVENIILSLSAIDNPYKSLITLKSHCRGVVIMVRESLEIVKEGDILIEIEVSLDDEYLSSISKTIFLKEFKKRISIVCQHDDFDDFDTVTINNSNYLSEIVQLKLCDASQSYISNNVDIGFTFIGSKFYLILDTTIHVDFYKVILLKVEAIIIFENDERKRYQMFQRKQYEYGKFFYQIELSHDDIITFATKSLIKAKIADVPVSFYTNKNNIYSTVETGQLALRFMAASILKYVVEKYPDKYNKQLVQKAKEIYETY